MVNVTKLPCEYALYRLLIIDEELDYTCTHIGIRRVSRFENNSLTIGVGAEAPSKHNIEQSQDLFSLDLEQFYVRTGMGFPSEDNNFS